MRWCTKNDKYQVCISVISHPHILHRGLVYPSSDGRGWRRKSAARVTTSKVGIWYGMVWYGYPPKWAGVDAALALTRRWWQNDGAHVTLCYLPHQPPMHCIAMNILKCFLIVTFSNWMRHILGPNTVSLYCTCVPWQISLIHIKKFIVIYWLKSTTTKDNCYKFHMQCKKVLLKKIITIANSSCKPACT